jgi:hypothetical protein
MLFSQKQQAIMNRSVKEIVIKPMINQKDYRSAPVVNFINEPLEISINYYDYFPGGYDNSPLAIQPETTSSGSLAGGLYLGFQVKETASANRRIKYAYFNANSVLIQQGNVTAINAGEGFPGTAMDPITGNPIIMYHMQTDTYNCYASYDLYHLLAASGFWRAPFISIKNPEDGDPFTNTYPHAEDDEFIWPKAVVGPSPIAGKQRLYAIGDNKAANVAGTPLGNILIGRTDFDGDMMTNQDDFEFEFTTIPELDEMNYNDIARTFQNFTVSDDGQIFIVGFYSHYVDETVPDDVSYDRFFMVHSDDYGDTYTYYETNSRIPTWNPQNQDGSYVFINDDTDLPYEDGEIFYSPALITHFNSVVTANNTKVIAAFAMSLSAFNGIYWPAYTYPIVAAYSLVNNELVVDVQTPQFNFPAWDENGDGIVDEFHDDGTVYIPACIPTHWGADSDWSNVHFHEGNFKITSLDEWIIVMWQDATKVWYAHNDDPEYADWEEKPEIVIIASRDYGQTWSHPAFMNAKEDDVNYYNEFNEMIPVYVYPANKLQVIDDSTAKLHFFFTDDYYYGSNIQPVVLPSMNMYAALSIDMTFIPQDNDSFEDVVLQTNPIKLISNYPNPFNPSTTIQFELAEANEVSLEIFNIKGQKVKTMSNGFLPIGLHKRIWDGKDDNNQPVSSGVYFYKLRSSKYSAYRKMILMK